MSTNDIARLREQLEVSYAAVKVAQEDFGLASTEYDRCPSDGRLFKLMAAADAVRYAMDDCEQVMRAIDRNPQVAARRAHRDAAATLADAKRVGHVTQTSE